MSGGLVVLAAGGTGGHLFPAEALAHELIGRGHRVALVTDSRGKAFPVANNTDSGGRQLNRRVEVVIGGDNGTAVMPRS